MQMISKWSSGTKLVEEPSFYPFFKVPKSPFEIRVRHLRAPSTSLHLHYGIQGNVNRWIKNWLANRKQSVVVKGEQSQFVSVDSGVPQGSVLGPCLFLYYINDLPAKLHSSVRLFADETIAYLVIRSHEDADLLQEDLVTLAA